MQRISVLEAIPQLSRHVAGLPLIPNGINDKEFVRLNPEHEIPGTAVFSCNFLDFLVEEGLFGTVSGFVKCTPVKLAPTLPVYVQTGGAVVIPPQLRMAHDVRVSCILLKS
jgi:hypothetical protein